MLTNTSKCLSTLPIPKPTPYPQTHTRACGCNVGYIRIMSLEKQVPPACSGPPPWQCDHWSLVSPTCTADGGAEWQVIFGSQCWVSCWNSCSHNANSLDFPLSLQHLSISIHAQGHTLNGHWVGVCWSGQRRWWVPEQTKAEVAVHHADICQVWSFPICLLASFTVHYMEEALRQWPSKSYILPLMILQSYMYIKSFSTVLPSWPAPLHHKILEVAP